MFHVRWSSSPSVGFVQVWIDGINVLPKTYEATLYRDWDASADHGVYLRQGELRKASPGNSSVVYIAATRVGNSYTHVAPDFAAGEPIAPAISSAATMPRITVHGNRLYAGSRPWRGWGMNWGVGDHAPVIAYFDKPTPANLAVLRAELRTARDIGANSMRVYLQLGQVMATPTRTRKRTLTALRKLLALAERDRIYLDITGNLVWQPARAPAWYGRLPYRQRWQVQARFWKAVARTAETSPAVLCYELTSEPIVAQTPGYYYGHIGQWWFVQSIATSQGPDALALARSWTRLLADTVRSEDDRPVTIGLLPVTSGPFAPVNIADLLDMLIVHEYPPTGQARAAVSLVHSFAGFNKRLLLGETFALTDDTATQDAFLTVIAPDLVGAFELFDGRDPRTIQVQSIYDALYKTSLEQFIALRPQLIDSVSDPPEVWWL